MSTVNVTVLKEAVFPAASVAYTVTVCFPSESPVMDVSPITVTLALPSKLYARGGSTYDLLNHS